MRDFDNDDFSVTNHSGNEHIDDVIRRMEANPGRRKFLKGGLGMAALGFMGVSGCSSNDDNFVADAAAQVTTPPAPLARPAGLNFTTVAKAVADTISVPPGYSASVLYRFGDPLNATVGAFSNLGTDSAASMDFRAGDNHDGMYYFGLGADGRFKSDESNRGLLAVNHEYLQWFFMHATPYSIDAAGNRTSEQEVRKEMAAVGVAVVEVQRNGNAWSYRIDSTFNRRITSLTRMRMSGPAGGNAAMRTRYSTDGTATRGTFNNCANGYTPWGTYLTCEENWAGGFRRTAAGGARSARENAGLTRYGIGATAAGLWGWATLPGDDFQRWNVDATGADATADYRNAANTFGWVVEIDPFAPNSEPRKRTGLGRFFHEGAWPTKPVTGRKLAWYMGCDARGEYIYKYVSDAVWNPADINGGLAAGDKYLDAGKLYVAKFNDDGTGTWIELAFSSGNINGNYAPYAFADQADVLIHARHAADAVGATKMDRPEWGAVDPITGQVYMTLTNNNATLRLTTGTPIGRAALTDAANPRVFNDPRTDGTAQRGNPNGHIIRWQENGDDPAAIAFRWDIFLFGARATADAANVNLSALDATNDFSSPDGLWFSLATGILWIQTDDNAYTDVTNCMLMAALPGSVGDGSRKSVTSTDASGASRTVDTFAGAAPGGAKLRRFLVGPKDCEITGIAESPDGKALFVNVQHPGEETFDPNQLFGVNVAYRNQTGPTGPSEVLANPATYRSHWPDGGNARPRAATIVITKNDGGVIGS